MAMLTVLTFLLPLIQLITAQQLISPCPRIFKYEPRNPAEPDKWYGVITLENIAELNGIWMRLVFDKQSIQLGNWFGEVVTKDNKEYLVKNPQHKLPANTTYNVRFYIKYNPQETPPQIQAIRLNARTVCPENGGMTEAPTVMGQLITSSEWSTTPFPVASGVIAPETIGVRPDGGSYNPPPKPSSEEEFFQGDFNYVNRPGPIGGVPGALDVACGTIVRPPRPLITHGQLTQEGEFPWHAALYHAKNIDLTYICGASLITKQHLITVAHCVTRPRTEFPLNKDSLVTYLGKYYLKRWSNPGIQNRNIDRISVHPKYKSDVYGNDIAILKMTSPIEITNYVRPVCLWEENLNLQAIVDKAGVVVGWGFDERGRITEELHKADMPVVSQETCIYSFPDFYSRFTSSKTFCAGFRNGTSVCNGDSGGGMVFPRSNSNKYNPVWQLRGLVSISVALQNPGEGQPKCDSTHYAVFTDVAKYLDWVRSNLN